MLPTLSVFFTLRIVIFEPVAVLTKMVMVAIVGVAVGELVGLNVGDLVGALTVFPQYLFP
jgi:hypothetical protein